MSDENQVEPTDSTEDIPPPPAPQPDFPESGPTDTEGETEAETETEAEAETETEVETETGVETETEAETEAEVDDAVEELFKAKAHGDDAPVADGEEEGKEKGGGEEQYGTPVGKGGKKKSKEGGKGKKKRDKTPETKVKKEGGTKKRDKTPEGKGKKKRDKTPEGKGKKEGAKKKRDKTPEGEGKKKEGGKKKREKSPEGKAKKKKAGKGKKSKGKDKKKGKESGTAAILETTEPDTLKEMATTPTGSDHLGPGGGISVPGVARITLSKITQEILGCVVGKHVTPESPWITIDKTLIDDNIDLHSESSDFLPIKDDMLELKTPTVLLGYDVMADVDNQFYICITESAKNAVLEILEQMQADKQLRVQRALEKTPQPWISLGSENEVDLFTIKNSRPFMQMQVETTLSALNAPCNFVDRDVDDAPDGYYQFPHRDDVPEHATRLCIDEGVQVSLAKFDVEAQTEPGIPDNSWTQYEYSVDTDKPIEDEVVEKALAQFLQGVQQEICDALHYNEIMDLHRDDYGRLVRFEEDTETPSVVQFNEFMSFTDMKHCQGKFISSVAFHPTWSGVVALSYVAYARASLTDKNVNLDETHNDVYSMHPVLVWSFVDAFKPKLILDCPRDVHALAFAPHKGNILVGGMSNGQLILWDLNGKIEKVEQETKMTTEQVKYNLAMNNMMDWMKSTICIDYVRPVAISSLSASHCDIVCELHWISPNWEMTNTGKFAQCPEGQQSLQVASSSLDGKILFWNLNTSGGGAALRSRRRKLSKRPEALKTETSPYSILHRFWQPTFKVIIQNFGENRIYKVMCWSFYSQPIAYEEDFEANQNLTQIERESMTTRFKFKPVILPPDDDDLRLTAVVGTFRGNILGIEWEPLEDGTAEFIPAKTCSFLFSSNLHVGPVYCLRRNPFISDMFLSVGSKFFAIWSYKLEGVPLFWRSSDHHKHFTCGAWSLQRPSMVLLTCDDGSIQVWDFLNRSDTYILNQSISGKLLTGVDSHPQYLPNNAVGFADYNGSFRLFFIPVQYQESDISTEVEQMERLVERERNRREAMSLWEEEWRKRNAEKRKLMLKKQEEENLRRAEQEEEEKRLAEEKHKLEELDAEQIQKQKDSACSTKIKAIEERWQETRKAQMVQMLLEKKKLNRSELERRQGPVIALQEAHNLKMLKLRQTLRQRNTIFKETVEMLFPELTETKAQPDQADVLAAQLEDMDETFLHRYYEIEKTALEQLQSTPLEHAFSWKRTVQEGRACRKVLDTSLYHQTARLNRAEERRQYRQLHRSSEIRREDEKKQAKAKPQVIQEGSFPDIPPRDSLEYDAPEDAPEDNVEN